MKLEQVTIPGAPALSALCYRPEASTLPGAALLAHGYTSGKYSLDGLASYLAGRGCCALTFDFPGHKLGGSGGEMTCAADAASAVRRALSWLRKEFGGRPIVLIGHSLGAAASLHVAGTEWTSGARDLAGVASLCMGDNPASGFAGPLGQAMLAQRGDYVAGLAAAALLQEVGALLPACRDLPIPSLLIAARQDILISPGSVERLAETIGPLCRLETIEATHLDAPDRARPLLMRWIEGMLADR